MDYRKLKKVTRKNYFPLPFIDQMDMLVCQKYYCFLDGYSGYNQIVEDQEKTTFTFPYEIFSVTRMTVRSFNVVPHLISTRVQSCL